VYIINITVGQVHDKQSYDHERAERKNPAGDINKTSEEIDEGVY